ncbi:hypothetical protein [Actinomadura parmotrematis]|uniref:Uncharacterized protein n=1 Tax=Actinomadura parmotrematis TaxID=2864039 RepID=A0ABS7G0J9_9ACTN|nr:hypothetical protein [Actinomadura parmotrematis]MBW8485730.1 hypothetical protein [Actinomadura parmotrematis]
MSGPDRREGPWEISFTFNTGYTETFRVRTVPQVLTAFEELFKRTTPPSLDVTRWSSRNAETGQTIREALDARDDHAGNAALERITKGWQTP